MRETRDTRTTKNSTKKVDQGRDKTIYNSDEDGGQDITFNTYIDESERDDKGEDDGEEGQKEEEVGTSFSVLKERVPTGVDIHFEKDELYLLSFPPPSHSSYYFLSILCISTFP